MWFRRLLLSYLPVFTIVTMILFVVFFQTLNEQNRREAVKANEFLAEQVIHFTDKSLKDIDYRVVREILSNTDVNRYFTSGGTDVFANIQALKVMDDLKFNYPIIDSVYFIRFSDGAVLGDAPRSIEELRDADFIKNFSMKKSADQKWTAKREFRAFDTSEIKQVITLVKEAPYNSRKGYFVVNVSLSKFQELIGRMYNSDISFVSMIDSAGNDVLAEESETRSANAKSASRDGSQAIMSTFTSPYTGWQINSGIQETKGLKLALTFYNIWFVLAIAVVVIGIIWVIYVTKRNYKPIQQLVTLIHTYSLKPPGTHKETAGEFGFIQTTLESLVSETKHFQEQYREKLIMQKKYHFRNVLEGTVKMSDKNWDTELRSYDIDTQDKTAVVYVMEIDSYLAFTEMYNERDQSLLKFTLYSVIHETAKNNKASVWAEWTADDRISLILWIPSDQEPIAGSKEIVDACRGWIEENVSFNITIGQGEPSATVEQIHLSYEKASYCLQFKAVLGANRLITAEDTVRPQQEIQEYFKTIYLLSQSLRLAEADWRKHLGVFYAQIRESLLPRKEIESLMQFCLHHLEGELMELSKDYRSIWRNIHNELMRLIKRWDTVDELQNESERIFEMLVEKVNAQRDSHSNKGLIIEIRSYIEHNYANSELSLDYLSSKFQLNAKYLSKMFKEEFGENFVDFLIGLRIDYAKKMLLETQKTMQSISGEVGYYNYNSFNRAFKNVVGLSPRDFRKQLGERNEANNA
ncbi:helix-turn-helix domain-containing protein [Paenibacillus sp. YIM B09110]|uniref:helix-turn-helix domain-containing protein n=1 Tax=Paenibacillus sp. YIM B09110 TaxID=3126102 RepID=UPI00301BF444